jgi:hypothetical protein
MKVGASTITVARRTVFQDLLRSYTVVIDDRPRGTLWAFRSGDYEVTPGPHRVHLGMGRHPQKSSSAEIEVEVTAGKSIQLHTTGHGARRWLKYAFSGYRRFPAVGRFDYSIMKPWVVLEVDR